MVDIKTFIYVISGGVVLVGWIVSFFVMQKGQNMNISQLQTEITDLKRKQSDASHYQIETEKTIVEINTKLDHIVKTLEELKAAGCRTG